LKLTDAEFSDRIRPRLAAKTEVIQRLSSLTGSLARDEMNEAVQVIIGRIVGLIYEYPIEDRELEDALREFEAQLNLVLHTSRAEDQPAAVIEILKSLIANMNEDVRVLQQRLEQVCG
jgi:hypothetical protein